MVLYGLIAPQNIPSKSSFAAGNAMALFMNVFQRGNRLYLGAKSSYKNRNQPKRKHTIVELSSGLFATLMLTTAFCLSIYFHKSMPVGHCDNISLPYN